MEPVTCFFLSVVWHKLLYCVTGTHININTNLKGCLYVLTKSPPSLLHKTKDPGFWQKAWTEVIDTSFNARRRKEVSALEYWNRVSSRMARQTKEQHSVTRVQKVTAWLNQRGVEIGGREVLDIGAGTGTFTLPFLERGGHVTALEPAPAVMKKLIQEVEKRQFSHIKYLDTPWEEIDLGAESLTGKFDLVFASLVPGIRNTETLEQMIAASRKWCFLCSFAGRRSNTARDQLWQTLMGETMPLPEHEVIVPLNYLYASGYTPSFEVWNETWVEEYPGTEAAGVLCDYFNNYLVITPAVEDKITAYVEQRLENGIFREPYKVRLGMILWSVDSCWQT